MLDRWSWREGPMLVDRSMRPPAVVALTEGGALLVIDLRARRLAAATRVGPLTALTRPIRAVARVLGPALRPLVLPLVLPFPPIEVLPVALFVALSFVVVGVAREEGRGALRLAGGGEGEDAWVPREARHKTNHEFD
jgi:hypothetical protein